MRVLIILLFATNIFAFGIVDSTKTKVQDSTKDISIIKINESKDPSNVKQNEKSNWTLFVDFISNPFASAALASILTLILTNIYNNKQKKKEKLSNYKVLLRTTKNELEFYISKFNQLATESLDIIKKIEQNGNPIIPTYSIYPKYLEDAKIKFNEFFMNVDIVNRISHCHFELSHISERLELIKKELRSNYDKDLEISNVAGFNKLINSNIIEFTAVSKSIDNEISNY